MLGEKKLFLVSTKKFESYVVAKTMDEAYSVFKEWLDQQDYGFYEDRELSSVTLIATDDTCYHNLSNDNLILFKQDDETVEVNA